MSQNGAISLVSLVLIIIGLVIGVYFLEQGTSFFSKAIDSLPGPSNSATIKIPIATGSAVPASASAQPKKTAISSAVASESAKPSAAASSSATPSRL